MQPKTWKLGLALIALGALASPALAAPGTITATHNVVGCATTGDVFTVTLRISGYTDATEIDTFQFNVGYDSGVFSFVNGSFVADPGGLDPQWLSKATQEAPTGAGGGGFLLDSSLNNGGIAGNVSIIMGDGEGAFPEGGTTSASGFLVSFDLKANAVSAGSDITPFAFLDGVILLDTSFAEAGDPAFVKANVCVVPEPTTWVMLLAGTLAVFALKFRRS